MKPLTEAFPENIDPAGTAVAAGSQSKGGKGYEKKTVKFGDGCDPDRIPHGMRWGGH